MENMLKLGRDNMKGSIWDECGKNKIVQILISHDFFSISSIQFVYIVDGKVVRSEVHGHFRGSIRFDMVTFDHPREYLTFVSGQYGNNNYLGSITFGTNIRKYGPFGSKTSSSQFVYNVAPKSAFGGFYGSANNGSVTGIGVYIKPLTSLAEIESYIGREQEIKTEDGQNTCSNIK